MPIKTPIRHPIYSLEWLSLKRLTVQSADKNVEQLEVSYTVIENTTDTITLGNSLVVSFRVHCSPTI